MPVTVSMPCLGNRWFPLVLGVLGDDHTSRFRGPAGTYPASARLFLRMRRRIRIGLIASREPLSDVEARVSIGMPAHLTLRAKDQRRTHRIATLWVPAVSIADDRGSTAGTLAAGVA